jgi:hypothetical protein
VNQLAGLRRACILSGVSTIPEGDLEAAVEARKELGREREADVVEAFLDRIEHGIDKRIDERLAKHGGARPAAQHQFDLRLPLGSMGIGIGVTAVANGFGGGGIPIAIAAWIAIALINIAYARRS